MHVSTLCIHRPVGVSLLALGVVLAGVAAYGTLPVAPLPRVDFPTIQVSAALPGASPETMAASVAAPLERRFGRIAGITEITSSSSLGATSLTLQFDLDRDVEGAARDVQAAINAAGADLPANLPTLPTYRKVNPADAPIIVLALTSQTLPLSEMFDVANTIVAQRLSQVDGVGQAFVGGGQQPAVRVRIDPMRLAAAGLQLADVAAALAGATAHEPAGGLSRGLQTVRLEPHDQAMDARAFAQVVLRADGISAMRLGDVASLVDATENARVAAWHNGQRAVLLIIRRTPGANIIETIERVRAALPGIVASVSPAIEVHQAMDRSVTIRAAVQEVEKTLALTVVLVGLVVLAFLRKLRATAIPCVAVPLSLCATFAAMYLMDYSLDNLSLMALTIATGFVVDDAIVVTENIIRLIEEGLPPKAAAIAGARQMGFTIVSITASLLAVFVPLIAMGGIVGRLFREFAVVLSLAILASAVVSLTVTPAMCAVMLRPPRQGGGAATPDARPSRTLAVYARGLALALAHPRLMGLLTLGTVALTVGLFIGMPKGLFPQQDTGLLTGFSEAGQDVSFLTMRDAQVQLDRIVRADPAVRNVVSFTSGGNTGTVFVDLAPLAARGTSADGVIARLRPRLAAVPGAKLFLQAAQDIRVGGRAARTQYQYTLQDPNLAVLRDWSPRILARLARLPQLRDVATDSQVQGLEAALAIDRDAASRLGLTAQGIDDALYSGFGQRQVAMTYGKAMQYRVVLEVLPSMQRDVGGLQSTWLRGRGGLVPLSQVTHLGVGVTPLAVNHQGQLPAVTLSFNLAPHASLGDAVTAIEAALRDAAPPASLAGAFAGTAQAYGAALGREPLLIAGALAAVYIILGVLYESLVHPLTIISSLPSAGVGGLLALLGCGIEFSIIAMVGMVLLIGIVKKNAIMMIDFAIERRRADPALGAAAAITEACLLRFRPIMMTTMAALLGALPLAWGHGIGAEMRRPLGITIVGGLLLSQLLTLFTTPVIYVALDGLRPRRRQGPAGGAAELTTT